MKTPEEIKKGLECCTYGEGCSVCPYDGAEDCAVQKNVDAIVLIRQLEAENAELKRERDAAVRDLGKARGCKTCKHITLSPEDRPCRSCGIRGIGYEWRGLCEENGGEEQ